MKRLVLDIDDTLSRTVKADYANAQVIQKTRQRMIEYKEMGFEIVLFTARNMRTFEGNTGKITAHTVPVLIDWLTRYDIPYDEIHVGKPWCGHDGFYVDDKAIRPDEFHALAYEDIQRLLETSKQANKDD